MIPVTAAIVALAAGVALVPVARRVPSRMALLDGFMLVGVGGVLLMGLLPHSWETAGWWSIVALAAGAGLPALLERGHNHDDHAHDSIGFLMLASAGLAVHAFLDGGALASRQIDDGAHSRALELGVLLHRLPMGVMLGMLSGARTRQAWAAAAIVAAGTIGGYLAGVETLPRIGLQGMALFQALVAGTLAHVIYTHSPIHTPAGHRRASTMGMLLGLVFLAAVEALH